VRPLRGLVANAGVMVVDTHDASADGYELTFAVNYLAHAQLIGDLLGSFASPARIVLLGSNTYHQNFFRRMLRVPPADWRDPIDLARPAAPDEPATFERAGIAYSNSKLAILYYAHELQRRAPSGINVAVLEPGFMPGTGLGSGHGLAAQRMGRTIGAIPGVSSPTRPDPIRSGACVDRPRRSLGAPARRRLCRQGHRTRREAVRQGPDSRGTAVGRHNRTPRLRYIGVCRGSGSS
jgi:NAD(P)-dependent dehydrogenase (short-subunit alcohol dehydrogenase family)